MANDRSDGVRITGKPHREPPRPEPPDTPVIPIVFLPGIMGTPLRVKPESARLVRQRFEEAGRGQDYTDKAWRPPNVEYSVLKTAETVIQESLGANSQAVRVAKTWEHYGPKLRQILLNPETVEADEQGFLPGFVPGLPNIEGEPAMAMARKRGWGSVHWDMYGSLLKHLEHTLNPRCPADPGGREVRSIRVGACVGIGGEIEQIKAIRPTEAEVDKAVQHRFPVHAAGYNWTQSNLQSAEDVLKKIRGWIQDFQAQGYSCRQVILVTHSMGGLVARVASNLDRERGTGLILGVVHGVMPAIGAPVAYRRMVAGTETEDRTILKELFGAFASLAGRTAEETTPVMANAPGALELLPSGLYRQGWLRVERDKGDGEIEQLFAFPGTAGPYYEIYREQDGWWRMVDPKLLDPAGIQGREEETAGAETAWGKYLVRMEDVLRFHQNHLSAKHYHSPSFFYYGEKKKTYCSVCWRLPPASAHLEIAQIRKARLEKSDGHGSLEIVVTVPDPMTGKAIDGKIHFGTEWRMPVSLQDADGEGDGTVPVESGNAPDASIPDRSSYAND